MSLTRAKNHLKKYNLEDRVMEFDASTKSVKEAALAVGCKEKEIAKTLSFKTEKPILIVVSGSAKIDNKKYKAEFKTKAKMIPYEEVEENIGHKAGGVCPFGIKEGVEVYLDESLKKLEIVYPACGTGNTAVKLTISELEKTSNYKKWVDVCKEEEI